MKIDLSKSYGDKIIFEHLKLEIPQGQRVVVLGNSGVGKTTLLNMLAGITPYNGSIKDLPKPLGYVFQEPRLLEKLSVQQNLQYVGGEENEISALLEKVGLLSCKDKKAGRLSGGEKMRVALCRAFLKRPKLLLLDEPFSAVDLSIKIKLLHCFKTLWETYKPTTVFVTHDLDLALCLGARILVLKDKKIVLDYTPNALLSPENYGVVGDKKILLSALT